jgi:hypothetical protein
MGCKYVGGDINTVKEILMKKKWIPHIIAVMALVALFFLVSGCESTPSSRQVCTSCGGSGLYDVAQYGEAPKWINCPTCGGRGYR